MVQCRRRTCRGRIVVRFATTCAISVYHHWSCEFESRSWRGVFNTTLCDKVCQWLAAGWWFSPGTLVSSKKKNWRPQYNKNIVESGIKHNNPNPMVHMFCLDITVTPEPLNFLKLKIKYIYFKNRVIFNQNL